MLYDCFAANWLFGYIPKKSYVRSKKRTNTIVIALSYPVTYFKHRL